MRQYYSVYRRKKKVNVYQKKRKIRAHHTFDIFYNTHLLVILVAVEVRLSLGLLEDVFISDSFFEPSFLNGSFMD